MFVPHTHTPTTCPKVPTTHGPHVDEFVLVFLCWVQSNQPIIDLLFCMLFYLCGGKIKRFKNAALFCMCFTFAFA